MCLIEILGIKPSFKINLLVIMGLIKWHVLYQNPLACHLCLWVTYFCYCKNPTMCSTCFTRLTARYITAAAAAFVPLSGMTLTSEIMQIYEEGNRSFEGCQLDLGTPAMTACNENLLCWQACAHMDNAHTQILTPVHDYLFTISLRVLRQVAFSHVKGHKRYSRS